MQRIDASALRSNLFDVLRNLDSPVEILRNGRVEGVLVPPRPTEAKPTFDPRRLERICIKNHVRKLSLFGSVTRDDFAAESDVDTLAELKPGTRKTLSGHVSLANALEDLFGRRTDLHYADGLEKCKNPKLRESILEDLTVIYEEK